MALMLLPLLSFSVYVGAGAALLMASQANQKASH